MKKFKTLLTGAVSLVAALAVGSAANALVALPACHSTLTEFSGWQYGQDNAQNTAQVNSALCFTVTPAGGDSLSFTDGFIPGDTYKLSLYAVVSPTLGFLTSASTTFTSYPTSFNNNLGPAAVDFAAPWTSNAYAHLQLLLSTGDYRLVVKDQSAGEGYPAGFGVRLDAVPEPASWALMLVGFGGLGYALRSRGKLAKAKI